MNKMTISDSHNGDYSAFGIKGHPVVNIGKNLPSIAENDVITKAQVEKIQENIIKSFPYKDSGC